MIDHKLKIQALFTADVTEPDSIQSLMSPHLILENLRIKVFYNGTKVDVSREIIEDICYIHPKEKVNLYLQKIAIGNRYLASLPRTTIANFGGTLVDCSEMKITDQEPDIPCKSTWTSSKDKKILDKYARVLDTCTGQSHLLLWHLLYPLSGYGEDREKIAVHYGLGDDGKTSFVRFLGKFHNTIPVSGNDITSNSGLVSEQFGLQLLGATIAHYEEQYPNPSVINRLKALSSGETITYRALGMDRSTAYVQPFQIFTNNKKLAIENTDANRRRFISIVWRDKVKNHMQKWEKQKLFSLTADDIGKWIVEQLEAMRDYKSIDDISVKSESYEPNFEAQLDDYLATKARSFRDIYNFVSKNFDITRENLQKKLKDGEDVGLYTTETDKFKRKLYSTRLEANEK